MLDPTRWSLWPAVAVLRWMLRSLPWLERGLVYRSHPSLSFSGNDIKEVGIAPHCLDITLTAPGLATAGSVLPAADIARVVADSRRPGGGPLSVWLDGPSDRLMQVVELSQRLHSAAFAFAGGDASRAHGIAAEVAGATAPLAADRSGVVMDSFRRAPGGALGLAAHYVGQPSAAGLAAAVEDYADLPCRVEEFTGANVRVLRPARLGGPLVRMLGRRCDLAAAGVRVVIDGGNRPQGVTLTRRPRRIALQTICTSFIGAPSVQAELVLELEPEVVEPAVLGDVELGGLAVLGPPSERVRLPLAV